MAIALTTLVTTLLWLQAPMTLRVTDPWGLPIPDVAVTAGGTILRTNENGEAALAPGLPDPFELRLESAGFETFVRSVNRWTGAETVQLRLEGVMNRVTVTATRNERLAGDTAASVTILDAETMRTSPARAVDDVLRQVPGFSLLRRTGSVAAHPTAQGVSIRGVGATGASRTLVLTDGLTANDPFGTWVYWNRTPRLSIESIEVVRGGASDLYGSSALGGVIHVRRRRPTPATLLVEASYGQRGQGQGGFYASHARGDWGFAVSAEAFRTDGYIAVAPEERGAVDVPVSSSHRTAVFDLERRLGADARVYANFTASTEDRKNGTPLTSNDTNFRQAALGGEINHRRGRSQLQLYAGSQGFDSSFSAVAAGRNSESLTSIQRVPLGYGGVQGHTLLAFGPHTVAAGLEWRHARGISDATSFFGGAVTGRAREGGSQRSAAFFLEDVIALHPRANVSLSLRWDRWENEDILGPVSTRSNWSPKAGVSARVHDNVTAYASAYGAFRAPSLNELYRPFRVGNVLTLANRELDQERMRGGDGGVKASLLAGRLQVRAGGYWAQLKGTVANVTLTTTPALITRQRANLGTARARGFETEIEVRPHRSWTFTTGYLLSDSTVVEFPTQPALEGLRIPQVPRHQYSLAASGLIATHYRLNVQARGSGIQYDNDLNTFELARYFTVDLLASRTLGAGAELVFAAENLGNAEVEVGRTPVTTLGMPRTIRVGLNFQLGAQ